jgi:hypothetical protein
MQRRAYLATIGAGTTLFTAGCGARSDDADTSPSDSSDTSGDPSGSTGTEGTDDADPSASAADGPEAAVRRYFEALNSGDRSAANRLVLNEDVPMYVESDEPRDITIQTIETRDLRTMIRQTQNVSGSTLDTRVERNRESFNSYVEENDYRDWAVVYASIRSEEYGAEEGYYILYRTDDGWVLAGLTN